MAIFYTDSASFNDVSVTGSLIVSGALTLTSNQPFNTTGSLFGTASYVQSSSVAISSSFAISASWAPTQAVGGVSSITAGDGLTGGTITSTGTITLDTSSVHFLDGVKKELNTEGVISSSGQFTNLNAPFTGSFTGSFRGSLIGTSSWANNVISASFATSASWAPGGAGTVTQIIAGAGLTGGTITSIGTITIDTSSTHFTTGSITVLNTRGVFSSSGQVNGANITNNTVSYTAGAGLSGGGSTTLGGGSVTIDAVAGAGISLTTPTNDAININTGSTHFISGARSTISVLDTAGANGIDLTYDSGTGVLSGTLVTSTFNVGAGSGLTGGGSANLGGTSTVNVGAGLGITVNTDDIAINTSSAHFLDGVKQELNTEGVVSSSTQFTSLTAPFTGSFTGSFRGTLTGTSSFASTANTVLTNTVSYTAGAGLSGGGTATLGGSSVTIDVVAGAGISLTAPTNDAININTASAHFLDGVKTELNTEQVLSGSVSSPSQGTITVGGFSNIDLGLQTSDQVTFGGVTSSLFGTSSRAVSSSFATTSSFAISASWAPSAPGGGVTSITAGNGLTGGTITDTGTITLDTSSLHFISGSQKVTASRAISASYADTFSGFINFPEGLIVTGSTILSGSTRITGSLSVTQGITGSLLGTSSWAEDVISASFATTASAATSITFTPATASYSPITSSIIYVVDGGGSAITTGVKGDLVIPFTCRILDWALLADQSGNVVVDIWKDTFANFPPTSTDAITGSAFVSLSSAASAQSSTLTGWTTTITANDVLRYNISSVATITRLTITLDVAR